eukprot:156375-Chlamydomonas_euryale.AAC.2
MFRKAHTSDLACCNLPTSFTNQTMYVTRGAGTRHEGVDANSTRPRAHPQHDPPPRRPRTR